ncbi:hypothetical protein DSL92_08270 [Billgrantia gudaonensis]|uniref:Uncharacterized protein n=1 Tax=Billgrantia gudaonensis TaxID=376427 RepID=A0A432JGQ5_9GAMM|nr:hypothetical protein DSL92_08270 [Halomonas gudaonensis]
MQQYVGEGRCCCSGTILAARSYYSIRAALLPFQQRERFNGSRGLSALSRWNCFVVNYHGRCRIGHRGLPEDWGEQPLEGTSGCFLLAIPAAVGDGLSAPPQLAVDRAGARCCRGWGLASWQFFIEGVHPRQWTDSVIPVQQHPACYLRNCCAWPVMGWATF